MRRAVFVLATLALSASLSGAGCLSQPTATYTDAGSDGASAADVTTTKVDAGAAEAGNPATNPNDEDPTANITYMDDLATHPGCTTSGLAAREAADGTPAGYTAAVINGGAFKCAAKEYGTDGDGSKPIVVLVHGNSSTPGDWETFAGDSTSGPMISETLVADGYHVYASDVRYDMVPKDTTNNPTQNYDHGWAVPIVENLLTNLFAQYPVPRMFNIAGFSIGPTVIRDALRRMLRNGQNPFARVHALHFASGGNHGVSSYTDLCGSETAPLNGTMAGLAACQLGNRSGYVLTPFETPLNGQTDAASFDTPCSDGTTAYGQTGVCGGNTVVYTTVVFEDPESGPLLDEFVSQASAHLNGANNMTVNQLEPDTFFFKALFPHHYGAIRSAQGIAIAKAALETQ
jgi:pimeloyl-ACP methyl ester carboxylesterase